MDLDEFRLKVRNMNGPEKKKKRRTTKGSKKEVKIRRRLGATKGKGPGLGGQDLVTENYSQVVGGQNLVPEARI